MPNYVNNRDNDCSESDYKIIKSEFDYNRLGNGQISIFFHGTFLYD